MPIVSASFASFSSPLRLVSFSTTNTAKVINAKAFSLKGWPKTNFFSLRASRFRVSCSAKPETVQKVCDIVKKQLALSDDVVLTPESQFSVLGADSLDTVEIVMSLEEEFGITIEEDNSQNITTVQEAANLIEKLIQSKS